MLPPVLRSYTQTHTQPQGAYLQYAVELPLLERAGNRLSNTEAAAEGGSAETSCCAADTGAAGAWLARGITAAVSAGAAGTRSAKKTAAGAAGACSAGRTKSARAEA